MAGRGGAAMPELPEAEQVRLFLLPHVKGKTTDV